MSATPAHPEQQGQGDADSLTARASAACILINSAWQIARRYIGLKLPGKEAERVRVKLRDARLLLLGKEPPAPPPQQQKKKREPTPGDPDEWARLARRRAIDAGAELAELVTYAELRERDGDDCHLCGRHVTERAQSFDHVIPLSRGGNHTRDNLKLAHRWCNRRKADRLMSEIDPAEFAV